MRNPILFLLLATLLSCGKPVETAPIENLFAPVSTATGTPTAIPVYDKYVQIDRLFGQRNDTTYLVNFWATWCKPCLEELPMLSELQRKHRKDGLQVLLVSLDTTENAIARIPDYLERNNIDLATLVLTDSGEEWKRALDEHWSGQLPTSIIYRNELRYIYRRNFRTLPDAEEAINPLIRQ